MKRKTIRHTGETVPAILPARLREMKRESAKPPATMEIPELDTAWLQRAERGRFYRPVKQPVTARLDADALAWLKAGGKGYQSRMNEILRREMLASARKEGAPLRASGARQRG